MRSGTWVRLPGTRAPEASWLLPAAVVGLVAGWLLTRGRDRRDPARAGLLLWGVWLLVAGGVLSSLHGISHSYYAIQLAPAVAGGVALGGGLLWQRAGRDGAIRFRRLLGPTGAVTAGRRVPGRRGGGPGALPGAAPRRTPRRDPRRPRSRGWATSTFPSTTIGNWLLVALAPGGGPPA